MGFLNFFKLNLFDPDAFEKELTELTQSISQTRNQILALSSKRKSVRHNLVYTLLITYVAYVAYRYRISLSNLGPLAAGKRHLAVFFSGQETRQLVYIIAIPALFVLFVYLVDTLFRLLISSKEKTLRNLVKRHRTKIDDLKRVTNFNATNKLLQKYGQLKSPSKGTDTKKTENTLHNINSNSKSAGKPGHVAAPQQEPKKLPPTVNRPMQAPQRPPAPSAVAGPVHKSIQDRLLDYIIGSDHNESVETRYALICANCYTHNGLAPPGCTDPNTVTYICRQCGFINGAMTDSGSPSIGSPPMFPNIPSPNIVSPIMATPDGHHESMDSIDVSSDESPLKLEADRVSENVNENIRRLESETAEESESET